MADERKFPRQIEFLFKRAQDYRIVASNGAWGGITTRGDIHLDFFVERQATPESLTQTVSDDGVLGPPVDSEETRPVVREIQVGVLLSPEQTKNLVDFLNDKLKQLEQIKEKK
jgi:hypothetical protein